MFGYATFAQVTFAQAPVYGAEEATATATAGVALTGHWRGPARGGHVGRIRRLSELDATATATEVLTEQTFNVDPETAKKIEQQVMAVVGVADNAAAELQRRKELLARERALTDEDETFMLM